MTILRSGPTKKYSNNWASAFGKKKTAGKPARKGKAAKKTTKARKSAKKK